jgi:VNT family MFS transporter (synaptic vesicle glycoprotein 2)
MAAANGACLPETLKLLPMTRHDSDPGEVVLRPQPGAQDGISLRALLRAGQQAWGQLRQLFRPPLAACTLPLAVAFVGLSGGWYSTVLWIPEYFKRRGAAGSSIYAETFAVAAANLPGNLISLWLVDRLGRRLTCCWCLAGACAAALFFSQAPAQGAWPLVAACAFNGISVGGWNSLDVLSAELYPTAVRASAMGVLGMLGR